MASTEVITIEYSAYVMTVSPDDVTCVRDARRAAVATEWGMPEDATAYMNNDGQVEDSVSLRGGDLVRFFKQNATSGK